MNIRVPVPNEYQSWNTIMALRYGVWNVGETAVYNRNWYYELQSRAAFVNVKWAHCKTFGVLDFNVSMLNKIYTPRGQIAIDRFINELQLSVYEKK